MGRGNSLACARKGQGNHRYYPSEAPRRKRAKGSTRAPNNFTPQCRCGPVTRPVAPTRPIHSTRSYLVSLFDPHLRQVHVNRI